MNQDSRNSPISVEALLRVLVGEDSESLKQLENGDVKHTIRFLQDARRRLITLDGDAVVKADKR